MSYNILSHKSFKGSIEKVSNIITDDSTRGSEARENVLFQRFYINFVIISFTRNGFYPLGHIVHSNQHVLFPNEVGNGPIKSMSQTSKSSISKIGLRGIMFRLEILSIIWHLVHVLQKSNASLNKVGQYNPLCSTFR